jgi:hypothetical protein
MDKKSKILLAIMGGLVLISAAATYYRTMVVRDFPITTSEPVPAEI